MINIEVNGILHSFSAEREKESLLTILREDLALHGTKNGCGIGACGACTVLVDGVPRRSCVTKLAKVDGCQILTIEGLEQADGTLHPVQQAFMDAGAVQCGFCTPGMILTAVALLETNPQPTDQELRRAFRHNLCRCTGYEQIFEAVRLAQKRMVKK